MQQSQYHSPQVTLAPLYFPDLAVGWGHKAKSGNVMQADGVYVISSEGDQRPSYDCVVSSLAQVAKEDSCSRCRSHRMLPHVWVNVDDDVEPQSH